MKKILTILLCGIMVLGMAGCGKAKNKFDIVLVCEKKIGVSNG